MSLILDALNRSETERRGSGEVPGLATEHFVGSDVRDGSGFSLRQTLPWIALVLAATAVAWVLMTGRETSESLPPVVNVTPIAVTKSSGNSIRKEGQVPVVAAAATAPRSAQRPAVVSPPAIQQAAVDDDIAGDVSALYDQPGGAERGQKGPSATNTPATQLSAEPVDIEKILAQAQSEVEDSNLQEHPAPFLADLSQQHKDQIPSVMYSVHNYSGRVGESTVVLNGRSIGEGADLSGGIKVLEILPDSTVFEFQGEQFRLRALNSWINL
jgi:general secretion pathway protein B